MAPATQFFSVTMLSPSISGFPRQLYPPQRSSLPQDAYEIDDEDTWKSLGSTYKYKSTPDISADEATLQEVGTTQSTVFSRYSFESSQTFPWSNLRASLEINSKRKTDQIVYRYTPFFRNGRSAITLGDRKEILWGEDFDNEFGEKEKELMVSQNITKPSGDEIPGLYQFVVWDINDSNAFPKISLISNSVEKWSLGASKHTHNHHG